MTVSFRPPQLASGPVFALLACLLVAGCVGSGGGGSGFFGLGGGGSGDAGEDMTAEEAAALRTIAGPGYCPKMVTPRGGQARREYAKDHEDDPGYVVWQASLSETARECAYDGVGTLTIRIGVSGRVIIGPAGQPSTYNVPLQISVEKFQEATLFSEIYPLEVAVGPQGSTVFRQVYTVSVPSPGGARDYLINVGFQNDKETGLSEDASNT